MLIIPCRCFLIMIFIYGTIFIIVAVFGITGVFQLGILDSVTDGLNLDF